MPNKVPFGDLWGQFCTTYFWLSFGWFTGLITFSDSKSYFARCVQFFGGRKPWGGQTLLSEAVNHPDATAQTLHGIKFGEARKAMTTTEEQAHKRSKGS